MTLLAITIISTEILARQYSPEEVGLVFRRCISARSQRLFHSSSTPEIFSNTSKKVIANLAGSYWLFHSSSTFDISSNELKKGIVNLVTKGRPGETVTDYCPFRACLPCLSSFFLPVAVFPFTLRWSCSRKLCVPKKRTMENVAAARGNCRQSRC